MKHPDEFEALASLARTTARNTESRVGMILRALEDAYPGDAPLSSDARDLLNGAYWVGTFALKATREVGDHALSRNLLPEELRANVAGDDLTDLLDRLVSFADQHHHTITC